MRLSILVAAIAALSSACGIGQPRVYRMAINTAFAAPATCYRGSNLPTTATTTNIESQAQWAFWDGEGQVTYLDVGAQGAISLGESAPIAVPGLIKGEQKSYQMSRQIACSNSIVSGSASTGNLNCTIPANGTNTQVTQSVIITFDTLGATATGNIKMTSNYSCSGSACGNTPVFTNCDLTLPFVGRKIEANPMFIYNPTGSTNL